MRMVASSSKLSLRPVTHADEAFLYRLYASTRQEEITTWGWSAAQQDAFLRMQFLAQNRSYAADYADAEHVVILADDAPVGRMIVHRTEQATQLVDIAILPQNRNHGIGTKLIGHLITECKTSRKPLRLSVAKGNPAVHLYARLGFTVTADDEVYLQMECKPT
jgi:ribosomal protein S18 acetylase RimI-like enzyme